MRHTILSIIVFCCVLSNAQNYQFLGSYSSIGTPEYLTDTPDIVSRETRELIATALPEGYPVPTYNPHYITSGYDTDLSIKDSTDVWVTFVSEGADYKNVLGFYTYKLNHPPLKAPKAEDITIIFPNISSFGSGGGLAMGDKVKLGTFAKGTGIGWVLLGNGWQRQTVTPGLWQLFSNPVYNPEVNEALTHHNVLLKDSKSERILLGFEDVRRDYNSCDHDFNDAVFYITAEPFSGIDTTNITPTDSITDIGSGGSGGLESNGSLASLIAKRNFLRNKTQSAKIFKNKQTQLAKYKANGLKSGSTSNLESLLPQTGMFGTEEAYVSSPEDLIDITNAADVFSVDYYSNSKRIAAVLATYSKGKVYSHSKTICDRLNSSKLEDVRTATLQGHQLICSKIRRANGTLENTVSFSVQKNSTNYNLYSYWNIDQYPVGDYYNFQIWGSSFSQVFALANKIINKLNKEKTVTSTFEDNKLPEVMVKSGYYKGGKVHLELLNKSAVNEIEVYGNLTQKENSSRESFHQKIQLSGELHDKVVIETGQLFDIGLSISNKHSEQIDALYLADGPWGVDYLKEMADVESFDLENGFKAANSNNVYNVERNPTITGQIKGILNLFRQVLPGDQALDLKSFEAIQFSISNTHPIEVVLMEDGLTNWENRYKYFIPANSSETEYSIDLNDFINKDGKRFANSELRRIVFSAKGDGETFAPYELSLNNLIFNKPSVTTAIDDRINNNKQLTVFPNPFHQSTNISINLPSEYIMVKMVDVNGRTVENKKILANGNQREFVYSNPELPKGMYFIIVTNDKNKVLKSEPIMKY